MNNKNNNLQTSVFKTHIDHDNKFLIVPFIKVGVLQKRSSENGRFWVRCDKNLFGKTRIKQTRLQYLIGKKFVSEKQQNLEKVTKRLTL